MGLRAPWIILSYYIMAARALLNRRRARKRSHAGPELALHRERPGREAAAADPEAGLPRAVLRSLRAMQARATMKSRRSIAERLYLVRSLSFALVVLGLLSLTLGIVPFAPEGVAPLAVLFVAFVGSLRKGNRYSDRVASSCEGAAAELSKALGIPFVVMSHTHAPVWRRMGENATYINTGAFAGTSMDETGGLPYLALLREENGFEARMMRYRTGEAVSCSAVVGNC